MSGLAHRYMKAAGPRSPAAHLLATEAGAHLFIADGSRLFDIDAELFDEFDRALSGGDAAKVASLLEQAGKARAVRERLLQVTRVTR